MQKVAFLLPAGFKKQLPESGAEPFVLNRGFEKCLSLYTSKAGSLYFLNLSNLNDFDPKVRQFKRYFLNGATQVELDSAGRILLPKNLMEYAGLEKDIVLVSAIDKIEIWDKIKYQQFFETFSPEAFSDLAKEVMAGDKTQNHNDAGRHIPCAGFVAGSDRWIANYSSGIYVDCTFGGGGHSTAILEKLNSRKINCL